MNSLEGFKDFDKVIRPNPVSLNRGRYAIPSFDVNYTTWKTMSANDYKGIFEVSDYVITCHGTKYHSLKEKFEHFKHKLPYDSFMRLRRSDHKPVCFLVKVLGTGYDENGKIIVELNGLSDLCYNNPVAGSMGDKKPEPQ